MKNVIPRVPPTRGRPRKKTPTIRQLRKTSQSWTPGEWEEYLESTEAPQSELLVSDYDELLEVYDESASLQAYEQSLLDDPFESVGLRSGPWLEQALRRLSNTEREVIYELFYRRKTQREVSVDLGLSRQAVARIRLAALRRLRRLLDVEEEG